MNTVKTTTQVVADGVPKLNAPRWKEDGWSKNVMPTPKKVLEPSQSVEKTGKHLPYRNRRTTIVKARASNVNVHQRMNRRNLEAYVLLFPIQFYPILFAFWD